MARFEPALKCAILCPKLEYPYVLHFKGLPLLRALDQNLTDAYHDPQFKLAMVGATIGVAMSLVECLGLHLLDMSWIHNSNPFFWGVMEICMQMQVCSSLIRLQVALIQFWSGSLSSGSKAIGYRKKKV